MLNFLSWAFLGYLCGSIPFGLVLTHLAGLTDIRSIGSGNIGATNVLRTGRKDLAAGTLICDALKATIPIVLARHWGEAGAIGAALGAFLGHLFPIWLRFRGGKGVATLIGCLIGLWWPGALIFCVVWLVVAWASRYSSLAALAASAVAPLALMIFARYVEALLCIFLAVLLWLRHRENIARLLAGSEGKIGAGR